MPYERTVKQVRGALKNVFDELDEIFELPSDIRKHRLASDEWSIDENLEHITLTSHFLMIVIKNSRDKILRRAKTQQIIGEESDLAIINIISEPDAFDWHRPEHMIPTGEKLSVEVRQLMSIQQKECLEILDQIKIGEGSLHKVRMSVQDLGKLDVYQWLYFLVMHAKRHQKEIERIVLDWKLRQK